MDLKFLIQFLIVICLFVCKVQSQNKNYLFPGEKISYSISYGIINAGIMNVNVDSNLVNIDGHNCYKTQIIGYTIGTVGLFAKVHNTYTSYIDSSDQLSYKFVRLQKENNYMLFEMTEFDRQNAQCYVSKRNNDNSFEIKNYSIQKGVQDIVSTYFKLRNLNLDTLSKGKMIKVSLFFEDSTITIGFKYLYKQTIKTQLGKIKTIVVAPDVPQTKNTILSKVDPIKAWITDDKYRIPVKIQLNTKWGAVEANILDYNLIKKKNNKFLFF